MNKDRRERLRKAKRLLGDAKDIITDVLWEEDDSRDNMPENLQGSERYEQSENCSDAMESAIDSIDSAIESLEEAT